MTHFETTHLHQPHMTTAISEAISWLGDGGLETDDFIVVGGASLVLRGIRLYTEDIDMLVNYDGMDQLIDMGAQQKDLPYQAKARGDGNISVGMLAGGSKIPLSATTHLPGNGTYPMSFDSIIKQSERVRGVQCVSLADMIMSKQALMRPKDITDLRLIAHFLGQADEQTTPTSLAV